MTAITQQHYDEMTGQERQALLFRLLDESVGPVEGVLGGRDAAIIPFASSEPVKPGEVVTVMSTCFERFQPERLVILEHVAERVEAKVEVSIEEEYRYERQGPWWRRGEPVRVVSSTRRIEHRTEHKSERRVPRDAWSLTGAFVGVENVFPTRGAIEGALFGLAGDTLPWHVGPCAPGMPIVLQVRHALLDPVPFRAVLVGKRVSVGPRAVPSGAVDGASAA